MELPNFCGWRHPYSIGRPSRWAAAHILVQSYCCPVCMQSKVKSPEKIWYIAYCLHILHIVYDAVTASCSVVAVGLLKIAIERLNSQDNTNMNNTHTQTSANHKLEKYNQEIFKIWLKFSYSNSGELQDNICYTMHRRQLCKAKKYWGSTILSPQYLEKYWANVPIAPMESVPMLHSNSKIAKMQLLRPWKQLQIIVISMSVRKDISGTTCAIFTNFFCACCLSP